MAKRLPKFEFTILVSSLGDQHAACADRLYGVCGDAMLGRQGGHDFVDFVRESADFEEALTSAITDLRQVGMKPVRIRLDEYVNASDIAARLGRSRQSVNQLIRGQRGPGGFPAAAHCSSGNIASYAWTDVVDWLDEHGYDSPVAPAERAMFNTASSLNALLQLQRSGQSIAATKRLWEMTTTAVS